MENKELTTTEPNKLPTLAELFNDSIELAGKSEGLNAILNTPPPEKWIKAHPYIKQEIEIDGKKVTVPYLYLPIDKVEYLLRKVFKKYRVQITGQGTAFNGVWVTVRVNYFDPSINEWTFQDGIGSMHLQVKKGSSPADLANINNGALSMAFPIAKSLAVKDACDLIGNIFGANLNRRDTIAFVADQELINQYKTERYERALADD